MKGFAGEQEFYFPNTVLGADLIVSLAKMKTHHWAGATLSMKNFFGVVPGSVYGWPKNKLHYIGIPESIVALNRQFGQKAFAIVDGVVGMEGNGPIQGTPKPVGVLVMGSDLVAVDSTCCRVMGIDPEKVSTCAWRPTWATCIRSASNSVARLSHRFAPTSSSSTILKISGWSDAQLAAACGG